MYCLSCDSLSDALLCPSCLESLRSCSYSFLYRERCPKCGTPLLSLSYPCPFCRGEPVSWGLCDGLLSHLIDTFRQSHGKMLATLFSHLLGEMMEGKEDCELLSLSRETDLILAHLKRGKGRRKVLFTLLLDEEALLSADLLSSMTGEPISLISLARNVLSSSASPHEQPCAPPFSPQKNQAEGDEGVTFVLPEGRRDSHCPCQLMQDDP